jgi:hypothetical protein
MAEAERRHAGTDGAQHRMALSPHQMVVRMTEFSVLFPDWEDG